MTEILVAIDIVGGEVVRLTRGAMDRKTVYGQDPVEAARAWEDRGARRLHLVDLDGATGTGVDNSAPIRRIVEAVDLPIQVGGGIRSLEAVERWLAAGVARVCIGTRSMDSGFMTEAVGEFGDRIVASLDTRNGMVQVRGWTEGSSISTLEGIERLLDCGVGRIMFTDVERDGTLAGPNIPAIEEVVAAAGVPVIAAGGVTNIGDIEKLAGLGLDGIVSGKALYEGTLDLTQAQAVLDAR